MRTWVKVYLVIIGAIFLSLLLARQFREKQIRKTGSKVSEAKERVRASTDGYEPRQRQGKGLSSGRLRPVQPDDGHSMVKEELRDADLSEDARSEDLGISDLTDGNTSLPMSGELLKQSVYGRPAGQTGRYNRQSSPHDGNPVIVQESDSRAFSTHAAGEDLEFRSGQEERTSREPRQPAPNDLYLTRHVEGSGNVVAKLRINLPAEFDYVPNGLIIAERVPPGWFVARSSPRYDSWDESTGEIKWLLLGSDVGSVEVSYELQLLETADSPVLPEFSGRCMYRGPTGEEKDYAIVGEKAWY